MTSREATAITRARAVLIRATVLVGTAVAFAVVVEIIRVAFPAAVVCVKRALSQV